MRLVSSEETLNFFQDAYARSSTGNVVIRYGDMKKQLAADMVSFIKPIRETTEALLADNEKLGKIMKEGKEKARANASETIKAVRKAVGISYY